MNAPSHGKKNHRGTALVLSLLLLLGGCGATTRIWGPRGAAIYVNGTYVGESPAIFEDDYGLPERFRIDIEHDDYEPLSVFVDKQLNYGVFSAVFVTYGVAILWSWRLAEELRFYPQRLQTGEAERSNAP